MVAKKEPVNITMQIVLTIIPFGWLFTFYRVEKLKLAILIIIAIVVTGSITNSYFLIQEEGDMFGEEAKSSQYDLIVLINAVLITVILVYLIVRWSKEWNHNMSLSGENDQH